MSRLDEPREVGDVDAHRGHCGASLLTFNEHGHLDAEAVTYR